MPHPPVHRNTATLVRRAAQRNSPSNPDALTARRTCPRDPAIEQDQPCTLQVLHFLDFLEQLALTFGDPGECMNHKLWQANWDTQDGDPLFLQPGIMAASPHPTRRSGAVLYFYDLLPRSTAALCCCALLLHYAGALSSITIRCYAPSRRELLSISFISFWREY